MKRLISIFSIVILLLVLGSPPVFADTPARIKVLIGFSQTPSGAEERLIRGIGGDIRFTYRLVPAIAASIPETAIQGLMRNPRVTIIEPDTIIQAVDAELDSSWGVKRIGAGLVHDSGNKGDSVKIAIFDTGIDYTHLDLADNYAGGYDFANDDSDPMDDNGHGTHIAGTIAAIDNETGVVGVAPEAEVYALKVLLADGSGSYSYVIAALEWCVHNGIQIANHSYASSANPGTIVQAAFSNAYSAGVLSVAAAGNSGTKNATADSIEYPAKFTSVVAVGATDMEDTRASYSSTGPELELTAPGVRILSTYINHGYATGSGTSMASPHVAGTAALIISAGIMDTNGNGRINDEVRQRLADTAYDLGQPGPDREYGWGLANAEAEALGTPQLEIAGVYRIETGTYEGKGRNKTYTVTTSFNVGDAVVIRAYVIDIGSGFPLSNATVNIILTGPETFTFSTALSNSSGVAQVEWQTQKPKGKKIGTAPGIYTAVVTNVTASGYMWNEIETISPPLYLK